MKAPARVVTGDQRAYYIIKDGRVMFDGLQSIVLYDGRAMVASAVCVDDQLMRACLLHDATRLTHIIGGRQVDSYLTGKAWDMDNAQRRDFARQLRAQRGEPPLED